MIIIFKINYNMRRWTTTSRQRCWRDVETNSLIVDEMLLSTDGACSNWTRSNSLCQSMSFLIFVTTVLTMYWPGRHISRQLWIDDSEGERVVANWSVDWSPMKKQSVQVQRSICYQTVRPSEQPGRQRWWRGSSMTTCASSGLTRWRHLLRVTFPADCLSCTRLLEHNYLKNVVQ